MPRTDPPAKWHIGESSLDHEQPDLKAYFFWHEGGSTPYSEEYTEAELSRKVQAERRSGDDPFAKALKQLAERRRRPSSTDY
jgi:hypothetical protein